MNVNTILYSYTRNLRTLRILEIIQASMMHKAMPLAALASTHRRLTPMTWPACGRHVLGAFETVYWCN